MRDMGKIPNAVEVFGTATLASFAVGELAAAGKGAIAALVAAYREAQTDFALDVLPQALGPLLTSPKLWHLLRAALCALMCAKTWIQQTTSDDICAQDWQPDLDIAQSATVITGFFVLIWPD